MPEKWIDAERIREQLAAFFRESHRDVTLFGSTVNQTFEAFVFAAVVRWYRDRGWRVRFRHPAHRGRDGLPGRVRLKFSTRGRPANYSFVECRKGAVTVHVRHQLRVATRFQTEPAYPPANVCLDVAITRPGDISHLSTDDHVSNDQLITFGEAKHMSAFAELVANFEGLVHEMQPGRLRRLRAGVASSQDREHPAPFLYVSGVLFHTAEGIVRTIRERGYDVDVFCETRALTESMTLTTRAAPSRQALDRVPVVRHGAVEDVPF